MLWIQVSLEKKNYIKTRRFRRTRFTKILRCQDPEVIKIFKTVIIATKLE